MPRPPLKPNPTAVAAARPPTAPVHRLPGLSAGAIAGPRKILPQKYPAVSLAVTTSTNQIAAAAPEESRKSANALQASKTPTANRANLMRPFEISIAHSAVDAAAKDISAALSAIQYMQIAQTEASTTESASLRKNGYPGDDSARSSKTMASDQAHAKTTKAVPPKSIAVSPRQHKTIAEAVRFPRSAKSAT